MAPAQVRRHLKGFQLRREMEHRDRMILAWHIQALAPERQRRGASYPSLSKFVGGDKTPDRAQPQTPEQLRSAMLGIVSAFGGTREKHTGPLPEIRRLPD